MSPRSFTKSVLGRSRLGLWTASVLAVLLGAEIFCRVLFATIIGRSVLFYGTSFERAAVDADEHSPLMRSLRHRRMSGARNKNHSVRDTDNHLATYAKYHPHQARSTYDIDTGEVYSVTINRRGFRGPEVEDEKPAGVIRVVTLGASSTFGYHNRDDLTYPAQLARLLAQRCPAKTFEVVNLGIPHLTSAQILALFVAEGLRLQPDVVTFYEGFNDASEIDGDDPRPARVSAAGEAKPRRPLKSFLRWWRDHSLLAALGDALVARWTHRYSADEIQAHIKTSRSDLLDNLERLAHLSKEESFELIVASQQARSLLVPREEIRGVTFEQELELVSETLARQRWLGRKQMAFLAHAALVEAEAQWADEHGVPYVDVRRALDSRRDTVVSWVHLSHEGNAIVAAQFADAILERDCPEAAGSPAPAG